MSNFSHTHDAQIIAGGTQVLEDPYSFDQNGLPTGLIFANNNQAARQWRRRSRYQPYIAPKDDPTIVIVTGQQEHYIAQMMQAMYNQDVILDNPGFAGRKLFTRGATGAFTAPDIEAACRCLFEKILDQCNYGYCGTERSPLVKPEDMALNCEQRVKKVIQVLHDWKCICKEIFLEDKKMEALANGPMGVHESKAQNKRNNLQKKNSAMKGANALKAVEKLKNEGVEIPDEDVSHLAAHGRAASDDSDRSDMLEERVTASPAPHGSAPVPTEARDAHSPIPGRNASAPVTARPDSILVQAPVASDGWNAPDVHNQRTYSFIPSHPDHADLETHDRSYQQPFDDQKPSAYTLPAYVTPGISPFLSSQNNPVAAYPPLPNMDGGSYYLPDTNYTSGQYSFFTDDFAGPSDPALPRPSLSPLGGTDNTIPPKNPPSTTSSAKGKRKTRSEDDESETLALAPDLKRQKIERYYLVGIGGVSPTEPK